jgi:hypothetical protein
VMFCFTFGTLTKKKMFVLGFKFQIFSSWGYKNHLKLSFSFIRLVLCKFGIHLSAFKSPFLLITKVLYIFLLFNTISSFLIIFLAFFSVFKPDICFVLSNFYSIILL